MTEADIQKMADSAFDEMKAKTAVKEKELAIASRLPMAIMMPRAALVCRVRDDTRMRINTI